MAKKKDYRRVNLSAETLERARAEMRGEKVITGEIPAVENNSGGAVAKKVVRTGSNLATRRIPTMEELATEYKFVAGELRYLLLLAGGLMVFIIIMAIILPMIGQ